VKKWLSRELNFIWEAVSTGCSKSWIHVGTLLPGGFYNSTASACRVFVYCILHDPRDPGLQIAGGAVNSCAPLGFRMMIEVEAIHLEPIQALAAEETYSFSYLPPFAGLLFQSEMTRFQRSTTARESEQDSVSWSRSTAPHRGSNERTRERGNRFIRSIIIG